MTAGVDERTGGRSVSGRLSTIARRALTLDERLAAGSGVAAPQDAPLAPEQVLAPWVRAFSAGDRGAWSRRLSWDGWDERAVRRALATDLEPRPASMAWTATLEACLDRCGEAAAELDSLSELKAWPGAPPPFVEVWIPFSRVARERLASENPRALAGMPGEVLEALMRSLLLELSGASELALYERFSAIRDARAPFAARWPLDCEQPPPRAVYREFVRSVLAEPLPFFEEYSVLARQVSRLIEDWVRSSAEFLGRLDEDLASLEAAFGPLGPLRSVATGLSDRHNFGRSVVGLTFASGRRLIYKPRTVGLESAYNEFLAWVGRKGLHPALPWVRILAREGYGWSQVVEQAAASSRADVEAYYRQAGMLLCLAYALGGKDLHMDNVIATAAGPVIIDSESMLQPDLPSDEGAGPHTAMGLASRRVARSFVRSGLLTFLQVDAVGRICDMGGLRGVGGHVASTRRRVWRLVNSDAMRPESERAIAPPMQNVLMFEGRAAQPDEHPGPLVAGFEEMYRFLITRRGEIALDAFEGQRTRMIFRPSNHYAAALEELVTPALQREGFLAAFRLDVLNRLFSREITRPVLWPLVAEERSALENLDIPYFLAPAAASVLESAAGEPISGYLARSGLDAARNRLGRLSEENLEEQVSLLRALLTRTSEERVESSDSAEEWGSAPGLSREEFIRQAEAIGAEILRRAVEGDDRALTWIAPSYLRLEQRADRGISYYLYDGASGIALFFAALGVITGRGEHFETARAAFRPIAAILASPNAAAMLEHEGIGACNGLGSILYALTAAGRLASDGSLLDLAERAAVHLTGERIAMDRNLDVEGGAAGAILGLLALAEARPDPELSEKAIACGRVLLSRKETPETGGWAWRGRDGALLAGLAHGAAGIALALARLYRTTGDERLRRAAREAHAYERGIFSRPNRNWPVVPKATDAAGRPVFMTAWCHGAPGIGLARAATRRDLADESIDAEIDSAVATTRATGLFSVDHVCCGNFGIAEVLLAAGRLLGRDELIWEARARAATVLARAIDAKAFRLRASDSENLSFQPGFFRGLAGIGYELLRMAHPERLPSVLLFESVPEGLR